MAKENKEEKKELQVTAPHVHVAVNQVKAAIAKSGISKDRKNEQQGYKFRGIDDVYNAMAPIMAEAHLNVYPTVLKREVVERINKKETVLFYVTVEVRFDFISAIDGSVYPVVTYGEAMDSGDKATNKAMSAALKYAFMQTFCIPTEGDNDTENDAHEIVTTVKPVFSTSEDRKHWMVEQARALETLADDHSLTIWLKTEGSKIEHLGESQQSAMREKLATAQARLAESAGKKALNGINNKLARAEDLMRA